MKLKMYYKNSQDKLQASPALRGLCRRAVHAALTYEKIDFDCEVSLTFTDNEGIRARNNEYRHKDSATDVLSFPMYTMRDGDVPEEDKELFFQAVTEAYFANKQRASEKFTRKDYKK